MENTKNLGSDEKMLILMQLPPHEAITVCESSKEMNLHCQNNKYNELWKQKIKRDFKITYNGNKAYEEYKFLEKLYRKTFYVVIRTDEEGEYETTSIIFDTEEKAEKYVYAILDGNYSYSAMKVLLKSENGLIYGPRYKLITQHIYNETPSHIDEYFESEKREYETNLEKLKQLVEGDPEFIEAINEFALKFSEKFQSSNFIGSTLTKAKNQINSFVEEMRQEFEVDSEKFKSLLVKYLWIPIEDQEKFL